MMVSPAAQATAKPKRRGRPIADDDRGDEALKARRERNREAQHIFRRRKQAAEAEQVRRMRRLEEVIEEMSSIFLGNVDEMLLSQAASQDPNLVTNVRGSVAKILNLAKEVAGSDDDLPMSTEDGDRGSSPEEGSHSGSSGTSVTDLSPATPLALPGMLYPAPTSKPAPAVGGFQQYSIPPQVYGNGWFPAETLLDFGTTPIRLSADSFPLRLVDASVSKAYIALLTANDMRVIEGDVRRIFNASLQYRTREELLYKMRWLMGPGRQHMLHAANANYGDPNQAIKFPIESTGAIDVLAASLLPYEGEAKEKFINAMDVYRQLERLGAKMVDRDTMEITVPCAKADPNAHPMANAMMGLSAAFDDSQQCEGAWGYIGNYPTMTMPGQPSVTMRLSAALLIESLCHVSMCLARGPGFPRHEICRAVETSVTQVYGDNSPGIMEPMGNGGVFYGF